MHNNFFYYGRGTQSSLSSLSFHWSEEVEQKGVEGKMLRWGCSLLKLLNMFHKELWASKPHFKNRRAGVAHKIIHTYKYMNFVLYLTLLKALFIYKTEVMIVNQYTCSYLINLVWKNLTKMLHLINVSFICDIFIDNKHVFILFIYLFLCFWLISSWNNKDSPHKVKQLSSGLLQTVLTVLGFMHFGFG